MKKFVNIETINELKAELNVLKKELSDLKDSLKNFVKQDDLIPLDNVVNTKNWRRVTSTDQKLLQRLVDEGGYKPSTRLGYVISKDVIEGGAND